MFERVSGMGGLCRRGALLLCSPAAKRPRMRSAAALVLVLVLLAWPAFLRAQTTLISPWSDYTQEDGLASNNVFVVAIGEGEIWFGTDSGISRFDGAWSSWKEGADLQSGVRAIASGESSAERWAGAGTGAVLAWDGVGWEPITNLNAPVRALYYAESQLWIGTATGLYVLPVADRRLALFEDDAATPASALPAPVAGLGDAQVNVIGSSYNGNGMWVGTSDGLWLREGDLWRAIGWADGLPGRDVTALWADPAGLVWVAADGNIAWRDPSTGAWQPVGTENLHTRERAPITSLTGDGDGVVWGGTAGSGFFQIVEQDAASPMERQYELIPQTINQGETSFIHSAAVDSAGSLWLGTVSGVFRSDRKMWGREILAPAPSPVNEIQAMLVDGEGRLWIATRGEGIRLKAAAHGLDEDLIFSVQDGLPSPYITDLAQDAAGRIWAGTWLGIASLDPDADEWTQPIVADELPSAHVTALLAQQRQLWIGTDSGLIHYDIATGALLDVAVLDGQAVQDLALDSSDQLWVATESAGIYVAGSDGGWVRFRADSAAGRSLLGDNVVALAPDPKVPGAMWAGVQQQGLNYFNGQVWEDRTATARLPSKVFHDFYVDPIDASLWIGSEGGVTRYDGRSWETLIVEAVLPATSISAIIRMADGVYWFGSRDGLTFYRPDTIAPWIRIEGVSGAGEQLSATAWEVETDEKVIISYGAGDLYTPQSELVILYRLTAPGQTGAWQVLDRPFLELSGFTERGEYIVELQARGFAFIYSEISSISLQVKSLPAYIQLPFLGPVRIDYLITLIVTGSLALIGFGYMGIAIVQSRRRTWEAVVRSFNPFISGEPVRRDDMFFGRRELLQRIVDTLHHNSIMIHGERRIGKTTLLYQLTNHLWGLDDPEYWFVPMYVDLEGTEEDAFFHFLMEEILHTVSTLAGLELGGEAVFQGLLYYRPEREEYTDREFSRDLRDIIRELQVYGQEKHPGKHLRLILLLDEMDVFNEYDRLIQQRLRRIFMRDFAATLGAVMAGIRINKDWDRIDSPWFNLFNEIELVPFNREQALELLTEPVRGFYRYEPSVVEFIIANSAGRPHRIQQYGLAMVGRMLADGRRTITMEDAQYAHEHIQQMGDSINVGISEAGR